MCELFITGAILILTVLFSTAVIKSEKHTKNAYIWMNEIRTRFFHAINHLMSITMHKNVGIQQS